LPEERRLLAAGVANVEIAERLFLAVGTVKRHVFNIHPRRIRSCSGP
jgi:DNA-binding NarL/FixJ family response regulator